MQIFTIQRLVAFLPLIKALQAQTVLSYNDAQKIAWRAYGSMVLNTMTAGQPLKKGTDFVFVLPPSTAGIRGGTPCPDAVTNADLFPIADNLQTIDDPLMQLTGVGYNQALDYYLSSVDLGNIVLTPAQDANIQKLTDALVAATDTFNTADDDAYNKYLADARSQANHLTFEDWVIKKDPVWTAAQSKMNTANTALDQYKTSIYGPGYERVTTLKQRVEGLSENQDTPQNGSVISNNSSSQTVTSSFVKRWTGTDNGRRRYNMPWFGGNYNVQFKPFASHQITDGLRYMPLYSISGGYGETIDSWINGTAPPFSWNWSMKEVNGKDWSDLGHSTSVTQGGGSLFSILSAQASSSTETTNFNSFTSSFSTAVSMTLTMRGGPVQFNVNPGLWDVPGVRTTYKKLTSKGINNLVNNVRITKVLVGHEVGCTISITDVGQWTKISQFIQDAKKNAGGGLSIWGFHFGISSSGVSHRNITDVQTYAGSNGGTIVIPPSPYGIPMMLGAMGKAM